ncbi:NAD(P)H-quinone oxidoreductase [Methylomonas sp. HYX-M1]|uniref:NAD(P)H-quinone oxidoreductase n=1 Tax=Methylomonas sp. HYX-M1 TaxID=3139307 RepID=UPI00345C3653
MRAIDIVSTESGNALLLRDFPRPLPGDGEVLIQVAAAGVNRPDLMQRQGVYPPPPGASELLGLEVAGTIVETGPGVQGYKVGDAVCALLTGGGYAEFCLAPAGSCLPVPAGLSMIEAAALPETFFTVWSNLFQRGRLLPGESVLVHGGASGIGTTAIQLARAFGNSCYVTAGSPDKCQRCLALGAAAAIDYRRDDFVAQILQLTAGRGVDLVLDMIGGDYFPRNLKCLAAEGRLVQIAIQNGARSEIQLWQVMSKRLTITGSTLRSRDQAFKSRIAAELSERVWPLLASGSIKPVIDRTFPLAAAEQAHAYLADGRHFGKIVLEL